MGTAMTKVFWNKLAIIYSIPVQELLPVLTYIYLESKSKK